MSYHAQDIRIRFYQQWLSDETIGIGMVSRSIRPAIYGKDARRCPKCTLVLRGWAVGCKALTITIRPRIITGSLNVYLVYVCTTVTNFAGLDIFSRR